MYFYVSILFYVYAERIAKIDTKCVLRDENGTVFKPEFVTLRNRLANLAINKRAFFVTRVIRIIANLCESTNWISQFVQSVSYYPWCFNLYRRIVYSRDLLTAVNPCVLFASSAPDVSSTCSGYVLPTIVLWHDIIRYNLALYALTNWYQLTNNTISSFS